MEFSGFVGLNPYWVHKELYTWEICKRIQIFHGGNMKNNFIIHFVMLALLVFVSACSTHQTTLKQDGAYTIYEIDEEDVFQIVYQEVVSVAENEIVNEVDGPERGYSVRLTFGLDWYDVIVKVVPVEGRNNEGESLQGYFVELGGRGTYPTSRPKEMMQKIKSRLDATGTKKQITNFKRVGYQYERDRWRLNALPSKREKEDVMDKLLKLKVLRDEGVLTEDEYLQKKKELLSRI